MNWCKGRLQKLADPGTASAWATHNVRRQRSAGGGADGELKRVHGSRYTLQAFWAYRPGAIILQVFWGYWPLAYSRQTTSRWA